MRLNQASEPGSMRLTIGSLTSWVKHGIIKAHAYNGNAWLYEEPTVDQRSIAEPTASKACAASVTTLGVDYCAQPMDPDEPFESEIDNETNEHVNQVKAGKKMPSQAQTKPKPRVCSRRRYDPNALPKGAVRQFAKDNPDFDLQPRDLSEAPEAEPDESGSDEPDLE
jgi:hypothetical protein